MSRNLPPVNASLIREIRMIAQQFFRSQETVSFWQSRRPKAAAAPVLKCSFCLKVTSKNVRDAITISNGHATCSQHLFMAEI